MGLWDYPLKDNKKGLWDYGIMGLWDYPLRAPIIFFEEIMHL